MVQKGSKRLLKTLSPQIFSFFLVPGFSLVSVSCAIDVLRAANIEYGEPLFKWTLVSDQNQLVSSSSGVSLPCASLPDVSSFDAVAICGGDRSHSFQNKEVENWLHLSARRGNFIGSLSDGSYVVASAGLYKGYCSTIHWKCQSAYRERFPDHNIRASLYEIDRKRFSCAGGTASLDLMLQFVGQSMGSEKAALVADNYVHDVIRDNKDYHQMTTGMRYAKRNKVLSDALLIMENRLEDPPSIQEIADQLKVSHRQLDRLFRQFLNTSPGKYYREERLKRATGLLMQTSLNITEIALSCGFQSASHLSQHFKKRFHLSPLQYRLQQTPLRDSQ